MPSNHLILCRPLHAGDAGSILGWKNPLEEEMATHSSILAWKISWTRGAWWATVHKVTRESDTTERLNNNAECREGVF